MSTIRALFVFLQGFCAVRAAIAGVVAQRIVHGSGSHLERAWAEGLATVSRIVVETDWCKPTRPTKSLDQHTLRQAEVNFLGSSARAGPQ